MCADLGGGVQRVLAEDSLNSDGFCHPARVRPLARILRWMRPCVRLEAFSAACLVITGHPCASRIGIHAQT